MKGLRTLVALTSGLSALVWAAACDLLDVHPAPEELRLRILTLGPDSTATAIVPAVMPLTIRFAIEGCDVIRAVQLNDGGAQGTVFDTKSLGGGQYSIDVPASYFSALECGETPERVLPEQLEVTCDNGDFARVNFDLERLQLWTSLWRARGPAMAIVDAGDSDSFLSLGNGWLAYHPHGSDDGGDATLNSGAYATPFFVRENGRAFLSVGCPLPDCGLASAVDLEVGKFLTGAEYVYGIEIDSTDELWVNGSPCDMAENPEGCATASIAVAGDVFGMHLKNGTLTVASGTEAATLTRVDARGTITRRLLSGFEHSELRTLADGRSLIAIAGTFPYEPVVPDFDASSNMGAIYDIDATLVASFKLPIEIGRLDFFNAISLSPDGKHLLLATKEEGWLGDTVGHWAHLAWPFKSADRIPDVAWLSDAVVLGSDTVVAAFDVAGKGKVRFRTELTDCDGLCPSPRIDALRTAGDTIVVQTPSGVRMYDKSGNLSGGVDPLPCGRLLTAPMQIIGEKKVVLAGGDTIFQIAVQ